MKHYLIIVLIFIGIKSYGQQQIWGNILDEADNPVFGATIFLINQEIGTISNEKGSFEINTYSNEDSLQVSYVGLMTKTIPIQDLNINKEINIKLDYNPNVIACPIITNDPKHYFISSAPGLYRLNGNHPGLAGSFDDPARAILKTPGVNVANDQSNAVSFHGMPPDLLRFTIDGADIINPNHLANAGTSNDLSSTSSGGVMSIPFQFLDAFEYTNGFQLVRNGNAANGNINLMPISEANEKSSFLKIGFLGTEIGYFKELGKQQKSFGIKDISVQYRYSFTGILDDFGVDFGGESLRYQDINARVKIYESPRHQTFITGIYGKSKNTHESLDTNSVVSDYKDLLNFEYQNEIWVAGITDRVQFNNASLQTSFFFSQKEEQNETEVPVFIPNESIKYEDKFNNDHQKISLNLNYKNFVLTNTKFEGGFRFLYERSSILNRSVYYDFIDNSYDQYLLSPFITATTNIDKFKIEYGLTSLINLAQGKVYYQPHLNMSRIGDRSVLSLSAFKQSQSQPITMHSLKTKEFFSTVINGEVMTNSMIRNNNIDLSPISLIGLHLNYQSSYILKSGELKWSASLFYESIDNMMAYDIGNQSTFSGVNAYQLLTNTSLDQNIYGTSISFDLQSANNVYFNINYSYINAFKSLFSFKHSIDFNLSKSFNFKGGQTALISLSSHFHTGSSYYINNVNHKYLDYNKDETYSSSFVELNDYTRIDLKMKYTFGKNGRSSLNLDIQNLFNKENDGYYFYDPYFEEVRLQKQLGLVPVLSYEYRFL